MYVTKNNEKEAINLKENKEYMGAGPWREKGESDVVVLSQKIKEIIIINNNTSFSSLFLERLIKHMGLKCVICKLLFLMFSHGNQPILNE